MLKVRYRSIRGAREWIVIFDLGNEEQNNIEAVRYAWNHNANIVFHEGMMP